MYNIKKKEFSSIFFKHALNFTVFTSVKKSYCQKKITLGVNICLYLCL